MATLIAVRGIENLDNAGRAELIRTAKRIGGEPDYLASVISFESAGSFDPSQKNLGGGSAIGLIQFMPWVARKLGTTSKELAAMNVPEQLAYVEKFYRMAVPGVERGRLRNLQDHYLAVFAPSAVGKSPGYKIPYSGEQYKQNSALDRNRDGVITAGEAAMPASAIYMAGKNRPRVTVDMSAAPAAGKPAPPAARPRPASPASPAGEGPMVRLEGLARSPAGRKGAAVALALGAAYAAFVVSKSKKKNGGRDA